LILRGPQTPGELRNRSERLYTFDDIASVQSTLERMLREPGEEDSAQRREQGPLVVLLPRQPGEKEARYAHTLSGVPEVTRREVAFVPVLAPVGAPAEDAGRLAQLEEQVTALRSQLESALGRLARLEEALGGPSEE
jgi:uncharacterized protein YceH (UPF0502 family)